MRTIIRNWITRKSFLPPKYTDAIDRSAQLSFSQSGEDMIVKFVLNSVGINNPIYIDVGASDPYYLSNTAHFYLNGSRGINIEANPLVFNKIKSHRENDFNLNIGVMPQAGSMMFNVMNPNTMSTFSAENADELVRDHGLTIAEKILVPIESLENVLQKSPYQELPHYLSIDIEGKELEVFKSLDFSYWSPPVICCETLYYSTTGLGVKNQELINFIQSKGYIVYADTYINTIFVLKNLWVERGSDS